MSMLRTNEISTRTGSGDIQVVGGRIISPGAVLQTVYVRTDELNIYSSINSGDGTPIEPLNLSITPLYANSMILCQWMVNGELHQDNVLLIWKNGTLASDGFNQESGNVRWSGYASGFYDQNESSTPSNWKIMYADFPGSTAALTYGLATRSSSTGNYAFYLNRAIANAGANAYENLVSVGVIQEIAQ